MRVSPRTAIWPQLVAISLIGLGLAGCADSGRFGDLFGSTSTIPSRSDGYGPGAQSASAGSVETRPLPHLASTDDGASAYGRNASGYRPAANDIARTASPAYRSAQAVTAPARGASEGEPATASGRDGVAAPAVDQVVRAGDG